MKLTYILAASLLSFTSLSSAFAADIVRTPVAAPAPVVSNYMPYNFSGSYAGIQVGGNWFNQDVNVTGYDASNLFAEPNGFFGGLYLGYNYQFSNNFVASVDTDFAWGDVSDTKDYTLDNGSIALSHKLKQNWNGATRVRLGYAADRFMPYLAAGVAYTNITNTGYARVDNEEGSLSLKDTRTGFTAGAGMDYALTDNMLFRFEYRYSDYGNISDSVTYDSTKYDATADYSSNDIRAGVAYKF